MCGFFVSQKEIKFEQRLNSPTLFKTLLIRDGEFDEWPSENTAKHGIERLNYCNK